LIERPRHRVNAHGALAVSLIGISRPRTSSGSSPRPRSLFCRVWAS
jgi:hypothetical protein